MKIGVRKPSIKKSFKARTTGKAKRAIKKAVIPGYGKKGTGWIKDPKRAAYNKVYNKTTVSAKSLVTPSTKKKTTSNKSTYNSYSTNTRSNTNNTYNSYSTNARSNTNSTSNTYSTSSVGSSSTSHITLINDNGKIKKCKIGYSWTNMFLGFLVPIARLDFKNFIIQYIAFMLCGRISPTLSFFFLVIMAGFYNKIYIKDLVRKGYKPYSDEDNTLLDKILNNKTAISHAFEISNDFLEYEDLYMNEDSNIENILETSTIEDNSVNYADITNNESNKKVGPFNSKKYTNLIEQKDDLYSKIQNMNYGMEENIKKYKSVLNRLLELSPNDKVFLVLLDEINLKEEYLISFYELQSCINILNNPRDLTADVFNDFLNEIKDIHLPKLKESEEKNIRVCTTSSFELESYIEEKTAQYQRKLKREEKEYRDKRNYVVFDLETTGLSSATHEITEIGAIKVIDGEVADKFEMLVKPTKKITKKITEITGITNEMVEDKPPIEEVLPQFIEFIGKLPLVAHNADFDYGFLCENYRRIYGKEFRRKKSCTMKMYRKWYKETWDEKAPSAKLKDVIFDLLGNEEFLSYLNNAHRGLNDAEFTQKIYEKMI